MQIAGILNITPDSFSDGNLYNSYDKIIEHTNKLILDGADIIDVGAESIRPGAITISVEEELSRLKPILKDVINLAHKHNAKISLDSRNFKTIEYALALGIDIINDVSASEDLLPLVSSSKKKYIFMHNLGIPADKTKVLDEKQDIFLELETFLYNKLKAFEKYHIPIENLIFDPGIGFGKTRHHNMTILKHVHILKKHHIPIFIGHSRKSFFEQINPNLSPKDRDIETLAISSHLYRNNIDYIRVHNVSLHKRFFSTLGELDKF